MSEIKAEAAVDKKRKQPDSGIVEQKRAKRPKPELSAHQRLLVELVVKGVRKLSLVHDIRLSLDKEFKALSDQVTLFSEPLVWTWQKRPVKINKRPRVSYFVALKENAEAFEADMKRAVDVGHWLGYMEPFEGRSNPRSYDMPVTYNGIRGDLQWFCDDVYMYGEVILNWDTVVKEEHVQAKLAQMSKAMPGRRFRVVMTRATVTVADSITAT